MADPAVPHFGFDKQCHACGVVKPLTEFPKAKTAKSGYRRDCKKCRKAFIKAWKVRTGWQPKPEAVQKKKENRTYPPKLTRKNNLFTKYKITAADYDLILERQGGVCALCRVPGRSNRWGRLSVDHCHETKRIRGLLCAACNTALGMLGDTPARLQRALDYLNGTLFEETNQPIPVYYVSGRPRLAQTLDNPEGPGRSAPTHQSNAP